MNKPIEWQEVDNLGFQDVLYHQAEGIAKITINRPEVRNAFRPGTVEELHLAFRRAHLDAKIGA
ncbi:MAG: enoyl-CoA hydratase-related protein, partial [Arenicellales bacterium]